MPFHNRNVVCTQRCPGHQVTDKTGALQRPLWASLTLAWLAAASYSRTIRFLASTCPASHRLKASAQRDGSSKPRSYLWLPHHCVCQLVATATAAVKMRLDDASKHTGWGAP